MCTRPECFVIYPNGVNVRAYVSDRLQDKLCTLQDKRLV